MFTQERLLGRVLAIDGTTTSLVDLFTGETGMRIMVTKIVVRLTAWLGVSSAMHVSFGNNATTYDNWKQDFDTKLTGSQQYIVVNFDPASGIASQMIEPTDHFQMKINTGATADVYGVGIDVWGYSLDVAHT